MKRALIRRTEVYSFEVDVPDDATASWILENMDEFSEAGDGADYEDCIYQVLEIEENDE